MLDSDVDSLLDVSVAHALVDDDADCGFGYVVHNYTILSEFWFEGENVGAFHTACFAVVDFVWHTLLDCTVGFDVDDVSDSGGCVS